MPGDANELYCGSHRLFKPDGELLPHDETPMVEANTLNVPDRGAVAFQFDVPLAQLKPGAYTTQVNVIDDAGGSFSFPRAAILIVLFPIGFWVTRSAPADLGLTPDGVADRP